MEDIRSIIAKNIAVLRVENGMTQVDLAEKLNYSDKAVSKWERGESVPEITTLATIADLFGVSLDFLVRGKKNDSEKVGGVEPNAKTKLKTRTVITFLSILLVWFVAVLVYVISDIAYADIHRHWMTFIYAIPIASIVWLVFNSIWFNKRRNYLIISILVWSMLIAIHLTVLLFGATIWQIYFLGIPGQLIIIMWSQIGSKK